MILDDDEPDEESNEANTGDKAEGASSDVETRHIEQVMSPYSTLSASELASRPTKSIDANLWYDVEEDCVGILTSR